MSFFRGLLGGGKSTSTQQTAAAGLQVQTSVQGKPLALIYGMTRVAPNLIWYGDFTATQQSGGPTGKGGLTGAGGKGGGSGEYTYTASVQLALGEGTLNSIWDVYADKNITNLTNLGASFFRGLYQQQPWDYLINSLGPENVEYYTIPSSPPYQVQTRSPYLYDLGVNVITGPALTYTSQFIENDPGVSGEYSFVLTGGAAEYVFGAGDNGKQVKISYSLYNVPGSYSGTITNGLVLVPETAEPYGFRDQGVIYTNLALAAVPSSPGPGQYSVADGLYTFNSAQAGDQVQITYVPNDGQAVTLGYSGIAHVDLANFSLGNNPSLPNFNFEVSGLFSQTVQQSVQGEQYTLPASGALDVVVRFAAYFIADEGVTDQSGNVYTAVSNSPGTNQYVRTGGTYFFASGNAGQIVNISYSASIGPDAPPAQVVIDLLTNAHYGVGFPSGRVDTLTTFNAYTLATGLIISPCYDTQGQASSMLDDIAKATNSAFVWSSGVLTLVPYGDEPITANGYTYTPPASPLYSLTDDDFLPNTNLTASASAAFNQDPVLMTRQRPADAFNSIKLEWLDRGNNYSPAIVQASNLAAINSFGLRQDSVRSFHMFCNGNAAQTSVQLQLQRQEVRNIYQFTLDQRYVLLDPMDIVAITDTNLGLNEQWVRINEITENDDGSLSMVAEEYLQGTGTAPVYSYQQGQGFNANYNADPGNINPPAMFEPTAELAEDLEVWLAVSGGALWGGAYVWISQDNETYQQVGKITGGSRQGYVDAPLPAVTMSGSGQTIDQTNTLSADISLSGGQLLSASQSDAQALATLCYLGSGNTYELLAYANAALVMTNFYSLSYLVRGAYDSSILAHAQGEQFARIDSSVFKYPYTQDKIGTTLYVKFLSFNVYGGGQQGLSDVEPVTFTLQGLALSSPLPNVANLRTSYVANITQLNWDEVTDFRPVLYEIRKGGTWQGAQLLGRVAHPPFNVQGNGTYWVSAFSQPTAGLQVYSEEPQDIAISGAQIVSNVIATWDEEGTGWTGTFGGAAGLAGNQVVLTGAGNILTDPDYLNTPNIFDYGGIGGIGTYTIPNSHIVDIGRVAPCSVIISWTSIGQHVGDNVLTIADYLNFQDLLDSSAQALVNVYPNIALSQDGITWGDWFKWTPGSYVAMEYKAQMVLETLDPTVQAILEDFVFEVDVPDRDDHYTNLSIPSGGSALTFQPDGASSPAAFNGGPAGGNLPAVQVTILNAQTGDQMILSSLSLSGCNLQVTNGGSGVARSCNVLAEGY
jgi:Putative phage tail protein